MKFSSSGTRTSNLLDPPVITSNPYRTSNSLANSVGYAIFNGSLMYRSGSLWKYSSNGENYNPCDIKKSSSVDYNNLTCKVESNYDSGCMYTSSQTNATMVVDNNGEFQYYLNGLDISNDSSYIKNKCKLKYSVNFEGMEGMEGGYVDLYEIRIEKNITINKSFSGY